MLSSAIPSPFIFLSILSQGLALQLVPLASEHFVRKPRLAKRFTYSSGSDTSDLDLLTTSPSTGAAMAATISYSL
ncbi:hypothetical protein BJ875DRAFT_474010, partial [Amylocarpus encephaloides]